MLTLVLVRADRAPKNYYTGQLDKGVKKRKVPVNGDGEGSIDLLDYLLFLRSSETEKYIIAELSVFVLTDNMLIDVFYL